MVYNTRRKSLSLPSLGIHVPVTHAARAAAAAAAAAATATKSASSSPETTPSRPPLSTRSSAPSTAIAFAPSKRLKRSHDEPHHARPRGLSFAPRPSSSRLKSEPTPPQSPGAVSSTEDDEMDQDSDSSSKPPAAPRKIDLEGINDDIVEGVIQQLEATGNRPHLVKELAAVLSLTLRSVQHSANPCAIISSRLSSYLKRTWTALAPCPLAKELESVHPRRTYFYLTTYPHQPIPATSSLSSIASVLQRSVSPSLHQHMRQRSLVSPSESGDSVLSEEIETDMVSRRAMSPSPEVDLSSPEFDDMDDDIATMSTSIGSLSASSAFRAPRQRGTSPPLEKDEREFTQTATGLQKRNLRGDVLVFDDVDSLMGIDEAVLREDYLFGESKPALSLGVMGTVSMMMSPAMKPSLHLSNARRDGEASEHWMRMEQHILDWDRSPESIELDELDCLLDAC